MSRQARVAMFVTLILGLSALIVPAHAAARPDLTITKVRPKALVVEPGGMLGLKVVVTNASRRKASRSRTRVYLSRDRHRSTTDRRLATWRTRALGGLTRVVLDKSVAVPATTPEGRWHLVVCADATKRIRESREDNNCRATKDPVEVRAADRDPTFPQAPDPITVSHTLQADRAVTRTVNFWEDTVLTTTATDGTRYELTIPAHSLEMTETITMTPVAAVVGSPLGALEAGVELLPHGLRFLKTATLVVTSPDLGPMASQTPFLYGDQGADFHLYPPLLPEIGDDRNTLRLALHHFSSVGMSQATDAQADAALNRPPTSPEAQLEAAISELINDARENGAAAPPAVMDVMRAYYDQVLSPQLQAAEASPELDMERAADLMEQALAFLRQMQLNGLPEHDPLAEEITTQVHNILALAMRTAWRTCQEHDYTSIPKLSAAVRFGAIYSAPWFDEAWAKLQGCLRFEIRLSASGNFSDSWSGNHQNGTSQAEWDSEGMVVTKPFDPNATGSLSHTAFSSQYQNTITEPDDPDLPPYDVWETGSAPFAPGKLSGSVTPVPRDSAVWKRGQPRFPVPEIAWHLDVLDQVKVTYHRTDSRGNSSTWVDDGGTIDLSRMARDRHTPINGEAVAGHEETSGTEADSSSTLSWYYRVEIVHVPQL